MCAPDKVPTAPAAAAKMAEETETTTTTSNESESSTTSPSTTMTNQKWVLQQRPNGIFNPNDDVKLVTEELDVTKSCGPDEIVVQPMMLSVDAFIRTMLDEEAYHGSVDIGGTIPAIGYGKVVHVGAGEASSSHKVGSIVTGMMGAQTHATIKSSQAMRAMKFPFMTMNASLGLMGLTTGLTAYAGMFYVCRRPKRGETVVVTGAAGAVGSVASQLAKTTGARVVGVAGGEKKCSYLKEELGMDDAIDYKSTKEKSLEEQIASACPDGIDFIYDNVGGVILDSLLNKINPKGRVVICGAVSQYSGNLNKGKVQGPSNYLKLAERGAEMKGFNVMQYMWKLPFAICGMFYYYLRGQVTMTEHIETGITCFPSALHKLFVGGHIGKMLVDLQTTK